MIGFGLGLGLGQLSVLQGLEGTDDWILRIFVIFCSLCFRGQCIYFSQFPEAQFRVISKIKVNIRFRELE